MKPCTRQFPTPLFAGVVASGMRLTSSLAGYLCVENHKDSSWRGAPELPLDGLTLVGRILRGAELLGEQEGGP